MRTFALTTKGQVTLPVAIRRKLKLGDRDRVRFKEEDGRVYVERVEDDITSIFGMLKTGKSASLKEIADAPAQMAVDRFKRATARRK
jgi:AbrB family looped-hinge helix DNA binding protein